MKWRIWLITVSIMLLSTVVITFTSASVYYASAVDESKNYLRVYMNCFSADDYPLTDAGANKFSDALNGARVTFISPDGKVIGDSATGGAGGSGENSERSDLSNHSDRDEIIAALNSDEKEGFAVRSSSTLGKKMVYYCKNFDGEYLVRIAIFTDNGWLIIAKTLPTILPFFAVMLSLCVIVGIFATDFIVAPVKKLAEDACYNDDLKPKYSELQPIADVLNERGRNIKKQMNEINAEKELVEKARASKDEFISNVTHEMNTPLTSIHGYAELLGAGLVPDDQKTAAYSTILTQSERLTSLIACIINYSEIDSENLPDYEVDFSALARETLTALKPEADKRNVTITENIDDNVILLSRHEYLSELFGNLVRNAIKYNKVGGKIDVLLNHNKLVVEDTGIGISEENKDKVFSRFFTVDKSHGGKNGGFGLGLAVVKKICQKNGWKISLDSTLGVGSKFTVEF